MDKVPGVLCLVLLASTCFANPAKDRQYEMGTLTKVPLQVMGRKNTGFTDTTSCTPGIAGTNCDGGIVDNYDAHLVATEPDGNQVVIGPCSEGARLAAALFPCSQPFVLMLTKEDGSFVFLSHTWLSHDIAEHLSDKSNVLYRIERHGGVTYFKIPDPFNPKKEGTYNPIKISQPKDKTRPSAAKDNIEAVCKSGQLTPEQHKKFCGVAKADDSPGNRTKLPD